jgi:hypothetical protein
VRWEKNTVAVTKSMAKAFIPNEQNCRKLPTAVSGKTDAVLFRKRTFSRQQIRHDELYCESKDWFLQLTLRKKIEIMTSFPELPPDTITMTEVGAIENAHKDTDNFFAAVWRIG